MSTPPDHLEKLQRAVCSLDGLSVGDALGQMLSSNARNARAQIEQNRLTNGPWWHTDDTQMAMAIVEVLAASGQIEQSKLAQQFTKRFLADPGRGYGKGARLQLEQISRGASWRVTSAQAFSGRGSMGNGAAMRSAPLGAYFAEDLTLLASESKRSAMITHSHPEGIAGSIAVSLAAASAWHGGELPLESAQNLVWSTVIEHTPPGETLDGVRKAQQVDLRADPVEAARLLGSGFLVTAPDTVPFALWCAIRHLNDFQEALIATLLGDGDCDTNCAIVGGIVAVCVGTQGIPAAWLQAREPLDLVFSLGDFKP